MYNLNGKHVSLEYIQAAAEQYGLNLEDYMQKYNVTEVDPNDVESGDQEVEASDHKHITRGAYEYDKGNYVEKNLVQKLQNNPKYSNFQFEEAKIGRDAIKVKRANDTEWTKFDLTSRWNVGLDHGETASTYDEFINFLDSDSSTAKQKNIYKKSGIRPENYPLVNTGRTQKTASTSRDEFGVSIPSIESPVYERLDENKTNSLINTTEKHLRKMLNNPSDFGIIPEGSAHSTDSQNFTKEQDHLIQEKLYETIKKETGLDMTKDSFLKFLQNSGGQATKGLLSKTKADVAANEKYINYVNAQRNKEGLNPLSDKRYTSFVEHMLSGNDGEKKRQKRDLFVKIMEANDVIQTLEENKNTDGADITTIDSSIRDKGELNDKHWDTS